MSTPERPQDPGEHGYAGANQDLPDPADSPDREHRLEDDDERSRTDEQREGVQQGSWPPKPEEIHDA